MRARSHAFALSLSLSLSACGGGAPPPAASPDSGGEAQASAPASPAAQCLATAGAKRARRPDEPAKIGARHVLVKYKGSKRGEDSITRTREEACLRAMEARDKIRGGADFDEVVRDYSDEAGAATRGGSVGTVERGDLAEPFADAAFELDINQLSDVVETDFGFHVILRTE